MKRKVEKLNTCKQEYFLYLTKKWMKVLNFIGGLIFWAVVMIVLATAISLPFTPVASVNELIDKVLHCTSLIFGLATGDSAFDKFMYVGSKICYWMIIFPKLYRKLLHPINPIRLSVVAIMTIDENNKCTITIRYWIMLGPGIFLKNVQVRGYIQDNYHVCGEEPRKPLYEWDRTYNNARGILTYKFKQDCAKVEKGRHAPKKDIDYLIFNTRGRYSLIVEVTGTDPSGNTFQVLKRYDASNIAFNGRFAHTGMPDSLKNSGEDGSYRYQNFNYYIPADKDAEANKPVSKYMITADDEIDDGGFFLKLQNAYTKRALNKRKKQLVETSKNDMPSPPAPRAFCDRRKDKRQDDASNK